MFRSLEVARSGYAQHTDRAARAPAPPAPPHPSRFLQQADDILLCVSRRLRFDYERKPCRRERDAVDVAPAFPRQRVAQAPPLRPQRFERPPHLILGDRTNPASSREHDPVAAGTERESDCPDQQDLGRLDCASPSGQHSSKPQRRAHSAVRSRRS
jgi:hypothetical protein